VIKLAEQNSIIIREAEEDNDLPPLGYVAGALILGLGALWVGKKIFEDEIHYKMGMPYGYHS